MCPFLEKGDPRCSGHLTLRNITKAFAHCVGRHECCRVWRELINDGYEPDQVEIPVKNRRPSLVLS